MKEKRGYKKRLIEEKMCLWTYKTSRTWEYTWSDGTKETKAIIK